MEGYLFVCHGGRSHRWGTGGSLVPCEASWRAARHARTGGGRRTGTGGTESRDDHTVHKVAQTPTLFLRNETAPGRRPCLHMIHNRAAQTEKEKESSERPLGHHRSTNVFFPTATWWSDFPPPKRLENNVVQLFAEDGSVMI